jgi:hypothetical protein
MNPSLTTNLQVGKIQRGQKGVDEYCRKEIYGQLHQKAERACNSNGSDQNKQTNGRGTWEFERGNLVGNIAKPIADIGASVCAMGRARRRS